jgi:uncharacterized membrane-anchored protein
MHPVARTLGFAALIFSLLAHAQDDSGTEEKRMQELKKAYDSLNFRNGEIILGEKQVKLNLGESFHFLNSKDTETVLHRFWGNPPGFDGYGMIIPKDKTIFDPETWTVVLSFEESGYVSDEDADEINFNEVLTDMKESLVEANVERKRLGYETVELKGWAEPPRYDKASHTIDWAKDMRFGNAPENTLNYNIRVLGRRGILNLNVVGTMKQLPDIKQHREELLKLASFMDGHRYADYQAGTDKVAAYGLAAVVAGGTLAKKVGFFKLLLAALMASKKLIGMGVIALVLGLSKLLGRKKSEDAGPQA